MFNQTGVVLPELTIIDSAPETVAAKEQPRRNDTPEAVNLLLSKLSHASKEASNSESLVEEVRSAAYKMVGFGPMFKALQGLSN